MLTYLKKNADYGNSAVDSLNRYGIVAFQVRAGDKINRIKSLMTKTAQVEDERLEDTLQDLFVYSCIAVSWENPQADTKTELEVLLEHMTKFALNPDMWVAYLVSNILLFADDAQDVEVMELLKRYLENVDK